MDDDMITYYTLEDAREILREEARHKRAFKEKIKAQHKARQKQIISKMLCLIFVIILFVLCVISYKANPQGHYEGTEIMQPDGNYYVWVEEWGDLLKGYYVPNGYMGYVEGKYMLFVSESEYYEYMKESD